MNAQATDKYECLVPGCGALVSDIYHHLKRFHADIDKPERLQYAETAPTVRFEIIGTLILFLDYASIHKKY